METKAIDAKMNAITVFDPKAVATFGNTILDVIVHHEEAKQGAERALKQATEREKIIDFELTRVALFLHMSDDHEVDLYQIYEPGKQNSSRLYRSILTETGVLKRVDDPKTDKIMYDFTDKALKGKFDFTEELKEKDEAEYTRRRSRRNALNMRLQRVCKAALALFEAKATPDDTQIVRDDDTGELKAVLTKGPKEVMGKEGTIQIYSKSVSPVEGATVTPTITGLSKYADTKHKKDKEPASKSATETSNRNEGGAKDFAATINAAIMVVKALEGNPNTQQKAQLKNLLTEIEKCVK